MAFAPSSQRISNSDRIRALELLGKYKAMFVDRLKTDEPIDPITEERRKELEEAARELSEVFRQRLCRKTVENCSDISPKDGGGGGLDTDVKK